MLSRVADSIYWMARYMERAENLARLLLANQSLVLDSGSTNDGSFWEPILMTTGDEAGFADLYDRTTGENVQEYLATHAKNPNSIINCVRIARENTRMVRDQLSDEIWRAVNDLYLLVTSDKGQSLLERSAVDFYETIMQGSCLFQGVSRATMMRNEAWQFLQIGTYLERADKTSRLIDACSNVSLDMPPHPDARPLRWQALLRSCSAWHGYREHHSDVMPREVIEFLFLNDQFARSVRFCVRELHLALQKLPAPPGAPVSTNPKRLAARLFNDVDLATVDEIFAAGLHDYIDHLQSRLNGVGAAIFETHVLYADLTPLSAAPPVLQTINAPIGAWHIDQDMQIQQQQQQQ